MRRSILVFFAIFLMHSQLFAPVPRSITTDNHKNPIDDVGTKPVRQLKRS
jgi:hypothetical protein